MPPDFAWTGDHSSIPVGDKTIELYQFGPSHGEGMTVFGIPEEDVLFIVDLAVPKRMPFMTMPDFHFPGWQHTLDEIAKLDYSTVAFAHMGPKAPPIGTLEDITATRQYLDDLTEAITEALQSGEGFEGFNMALSVTLPQYQEWGFYDEWMSLNAIGATMHVLLGY